jgi:hypothetical protein
MVRNVILSVVTLSVLFCVRIESRSQAFTDLSIKERSLFEELQNLTIKLAPTLWPDWPKEFPPFLLRTDTQELLVGHPNPSGDFSPFYSQTLGRRLWSRATTDTSDVQASYPISGVKTAIMSTPSQSENPYVWVLKAAHEVFHCYQGSTRIRDPFVGKFVSYHDLSFPFPYSDSALAAALRLEAEVVFRLATAEASDKSSLFVQSRLLPFTWRVQQRLSSEREFQDYKILTEWSEGVARYTERELARLAGTPGRYEPTSSFAQLFPGSSYGSVWREQYADATMINPIRFVGEGVRGRVMFYFLGMGKAYALDRINPEWRAAYRKTTLDDLLDQGTAQLSR